MGEQLEEHREWWGIRGTVRECFAHRESAAVGVRDELRGSAEEAAVGLREGGKVVSLKGMRLPRIRVQKAPHATVFPAFNPF
jgi:hypothetical protein